MTVKNHSILIVDDNLEILDMVAESLSIAGFTQLTKASSQKEAIEYLNQETFDFAILDIMLPDGSGFNILRYIRQSSLMPVLFLSAISDIEKQYQGFELGADDYIVKPFRPKELELRVVSILRRVYPERQVLVSLQGCQLDLERALVLKNDREVALTAKEFKILTTLLDNRNKIVTIDALLQKVWGDTYMGYENTLMAHIRKIRQKIEDNPSKPINLITVKGLGYQLRVTT